MLNHARILLFAVSKAVDVQGCYRDNPGARDLPVAITGFDRTLTPAACVSACRGAGYSYAGVQVVTLAFYSLSLVRLALPTSIWFSRTNSYSTVVLSSGNARRTKSGTYTVIHKKETTFFVCNFDKNKQILMQFSLLDLKMNGTCDSMNFIHLT